MTRFISDQNKLVLIQESGTYANTSGTGQWIGQVTEVAITDEENKIIDRYLGRANRDFHAADLGPRDVSVDVTYYPQDMKLLFHAIGSVQDLAGTATAVAHYVNEVNNDQWISPFTSGTGKQAAPVSFTFEDSKSSPGTGRNAIRTVKGCIPDTVTLSSSNGEKVTIEASYIGQTLTYSSGASTAVTDIATVPYLWNHCTITVSGLVLDTTKDFDFEINNNLEAPHYINGSRDIGTPFFKNREYTLNITADLDADKADTLYNSLYKNTGTTVAFNTTIDLNGDRTTGSLHTILFLSGCRMTAMDYDSVVEGPVEASIEITAQSVIGSSIDITTKYCPW